MRMNTNLDRVAISILKKNDRGGYSVPTAGLYPYQWNWDSAFAALGYAAFDRDRAWRELESLFAAQWEDGFTPHIVFHVDDPGYFPGPSEWRTGRNPQTSGITQPPVAASVARWLWESGDGSDRDRLERLFPRLLAWRRWFARYRDPLKNGLALATHPWETGRDNSPEWDAPAAQIDISAVGSYERRDTSFVNHDMRPLKEDYHRYVAILQFGREHRWNHSVIAEFGPFRVIDVGMSMIQLRATRDLLSLATILGRQDEADELRALVGLGEAGVGYLWDDGIGAYCSRDLATGASSGVITSASFLAFYAGVGNADEHSRLIAHLRRIGKRVRFLAPSCDPEHAAFDPRRYWRGPAWVVLNFMIGLGLAEQDHADCALRIKEDTRALIEKSGFFEAYCPLTGNGVGAGDFSWTAAMWLHWARSAQVRNRDAVTARKRNSF